ncbi:sigma-70 family RNA polymerase sigma factor [Leifsonia shinshuensis]|uniref:RNA polymerase sigma factor n=1 Tax=Leifsonia shinshuensis TaxID=150026 RepID=UPI0028571690|nr:sigma-70 family RNA polymerase sigma factor [Leifsonia shinshuensis]MDR6971354.1 RNA polymerase sigma-70 factor (ECF subfamily) [Leifsonia shinshuensis]
MTTDETGEPAMLVRARRGDPQAFGELFDLHRDRVFRHALRMTRSVHDAEDVTGMVFLEAWRRRDALTEVDGSVIGWLLVTANNVSRNLSRSIRRYRHTLSTLPAPEDSPDHSNSVDERLDSHPQLAALREALARLPRRDQDVLSLCVMEELSTADAAAVLNIPTGTVKSRLSRAKARLAALLTPIDTIISMEGGDR